MVGGIMQGLHRSSVSMLLQTGITTVCAQVWEKHFSRVYLSVRVPLSGSEGKKCAASARICGLWRRHSGGVG